MEKESNYGYIEYKRFIKFFHPQRYGELVCQLRYRLIEGSGRCIYMIGLEDSGSIYNLTNEEYEESLENLKKMCESADAEIISIKQITNGEETYYKIIINDIITDNEFRILNILEYDIENFTIDIIGIDKNNNTLKLDDTNSYDLKKLSKYIIYICNVSRKDIIRSLLNFKPHSINYSKEKDRYLKLFNDLNIPVFSMNIYDNILDIIKVKKEYPINNTNIFNIFQTLYKGSVLNNTKIYACITNDIIENKDQLYIYNFESNSEKIKKQKLIIDEIYHIYQPVTKIKMDKLISISTLNNLTTNDIHICLNKTNEECKCIENKLINFTNIIDLTNFTNLKNSDPKKYYNAYYKNDLLKVKLIDNKIILNKKIVFDKNMLIVDIETEFLFINI